MALIAAQTAADRHYYRSRNCATGKRLINIKGISGGCCRVGELPSSGRPDERG